MTRSHVIYPELETWSSQKVKRVFIWYKVIIEISQEVKASSQKVEKRINLVEGNNWDFPGVQTSSQEVKKGIYQVEGNNWDFPGSENEFPGSVKRIYLVEGNKWDFPGVETSSPEAEKSIYCNS